VHFHRIRLSSRVSSPRTKRRQDSVAVAFILGIVVGAGPAHLAEAGQPIVLHTDTPPSAATSGGLLSWRIGQGRRYTLRLRTTVSMAGGAQLVAFEIRGPLALVAITEQPTFLLRMEFSGEISNFEGAIASEHTDRKEQVSKQIVAALRAPYFMEFSPGGDLLGLRTTVQMSFVTQIWQTLAASMQFKTKEHGDSEWEVEEDDTVGRYLAAYRYRGEGAYEKRKLRYLQVRVPGLTYSGVVSEGTFQFAPKGEIERLGVRETLEVEGAAPIPSLRSETEIELNALSGDFVEADVGSLRTAAQALPLVRPSQVTAGLSPAALDEARASRMELTQALALLRAERESAERGTLTEEEKRGADRAYVALTALLRLHPEELKTVEAEVRAGSPLSGALIEALRDAGSAEAQALLRDLVTLPTLDDVRHMQAAQALSHVEVPTPETVAALERLQADDKLGVQATYGLGSNIYRLQKTDPSRAGSLLAALERRLSAAMTDRERTTLLTTLGNAGHPASLGSISRFVEHGSIEVRVAAAQALRRIPEETADDLLVKLSEDPDENVRFSAMDAISERSASPVLEHRVAAMALGEPDFKTRVQAVRTAVDWLETTPGLASTLELVSNRDDSEDIRRTARTALDRWKAARRSDRHRSRRSAIP
jgi:HEAT repeat protein